MRGRYPGRCRQSRSRASWLHVRPANPCVERPIRYALKVGVGEPLLAAPLEYAVGYMRARTIVKWRNRPTLGSRALTAARAGARAFGFRTAHAPDHRQRTLTSSSAYGSWVQFTQARDAGDDEGAVSSGRRRRWPLRPAGKRKPPFAHSPAATSTRLDSGSNSGTPLISLWHQTGTLIPPLNRIPGPPFVARF